MPLASTRFAVRESTADNGVLVSRKAAKRELISEGLADGLARSPGGLAGTADDGGQLKLATKQAT